MSITIDDLRHFISKECCIPVDKIYNDSKLTTDLGIAGDDGYELIDSISRYYGMDLSNYDFYQYFGDEIGAGPVDLLILLLVALKLRPKDKMRDLTIEDLYQIVIAEQNARSMDEQNGNLVL